MAIFFLLVCFFVNAFMLSVVRYRGSRRVVIVIVEIFRRHRWLRTDDAESASNVRLKRIRLTVDAIERMFRDVYTVFVRCWIRTWTLFSADRNSTERQTVNGAVPPAISRAPLFGFYYSVRDGVSERFRRFDAKQDAAEAIERYFNMKRVGPREPRDFARNGTRASPFWIIPCLSHGVSSTSIYRSFWSVRNDVLLDG